MKLPKFMKHSNASYTPQRSIKVAGSSSAVSTILSISNQQHQLLLTDDICRFQPKKNTQKPLANKENHYDVCDHVAMSKKTPKSTKAAPFVETESFLFFKETTPTRNNSANTPKVIQLNTNLFGSAKSSNLMSSAQSNRFVKSAQPKRLQRKTAPSSKLSSNNNYDLRSSSSSKNMNTPSLIKTQKSKSSIIQINETPIRCLNSQSNLLHELNDNNVITISNTTPAKQESAFSKLSKFVSKSALKVMNSRKSLDAISNKRPNSNASSPASSMNASPCSSNNSSMTEPQQQQAQTENIYNYIDENFVRNQIVEQQKQQASIYQSVEQEEQFKHKLNQHLSQMKQTCKLAKPVMGVSSLMLKQHKKNNSTLYHSAASYCSTSAFMVSLPIVFKSNEHEFSTSTKYNYLTNNTNSNYDHLSRIQPPNCHSTMINQTINQTKTNFKSLSDLSKFSSNNYNSFNRISIFNSESNSTVSSSSSQYDTVQETVF